MIVMSNEGGAKGKRREKRLGRDQRLRDGVKGAGGEGRDSWDQSYEGGDGGHCFTLCAAACRCRCIGISYACKGRAPRFGR